MLPVVDPDGRSTFFQTVVYAAALVPISLIPTFIGMSGKIYLYGALVSGLAMLFIALMLASSKSVQDAKRLLKASVIYLPVLLFLIVIDVSF